MPKEMEADSRDRAPEKSLVPCARVTFTMPMAIPNCSVMFTSVVPGEGRTVSGEIFTCPNVFWDRVADKIVIEGRMYPMEHVAYFERARMASNIKPATVPDYTIGKRS